MEIDLDNPPFEDECWQFIYDVLAGTFITSGKIKQLCSILAKRGTTYKRWHYDHDAAWRAVSFVEKFCCQTAGDIGQRLVLQPFQRFVVATIFGWVDDDGKRQYQEVLMVIGRKNGKTTLCAAIMQYLLVADGKVAFVKTGESKQSGALYSFHDVLAWMNAHAQRKTPKATRRTA